MHHDVHAILHTYRSAELRKQAAEFTAPRTRLRSRMGWVMVEVGLRLAQNAPAPARAARAA
ncbi:hypothetical protein [Streptomyces sp. NRRL WC-3549]|uniref:hypothetical protein n=1 Tax=Streptomyces sp. NRRL WC-3549 TaxID=1463925 RepID=UPI0004CB6290|nr:hypothetical protein [Streptomyces sp. NRRL WC-3549]